MSISTTKALGLIGHVLERYSTVDLTIELHSQICKPCDADDCEDCPGFALLGHIVNQIGEAGVDFMKQLVKEWRENSVDL
ncbi:MAG: hypothetical protein HWN69_10145 [Desulfobacterales bacterium]|nr:hypothetical protein [Desulfobacterales bacterium]